ncbi:hypothetical protein ACLB2K_058904 [Fragaria x ananassa]
MAATHHRGRSWSSRVCLNGKDLRDHPTNTWFFQCFHFCLVGIQLRAYPPARLPLRMGLLFLRSWFLLSYEQLVFQHPILAVRLIILSFMVLSKASTLVFRPDAPPPTGSGSGSDP